MYTEFLNKQVIVHSPKAGIYYGTLEASDKGTCRLSKARNLWEWEGARTLAHIASTGVTFGKASPIVQNIVIEEVAQIILIEDMALSSLNNLQVWN